MKLLIILRGSLRSSIGVGPSVESRSHCVRWKINFAYVQERTM